MNRIRQFFGKGQKKQEDRSLKTLECAQCGKPVLTTSEFYDAVEAKGFQVDRATGKVNATVSGIFGSFDGLGTIQHDRQQIFTEIDSRRGYQCVNCGRAYCTVCLRTAPHHPQTGGRACPNCGGSFRRLGEV